MEFKRKYKTNSVSPIWLFLKTKWVVTTVEINVWKNTKYNTSVLITNEI